MYALVGGHRVKLHVHTIQALVLGSTVAHLEEIPTGRTLSCEKLCVRLERVVCGSVNWNIQDSERRILRLKHTTNPNAVNKMKEIGLQRDFPTKKMYRKP